MKFVVDSSVIVSAVLGRYDLFGPVLANGAVLMTTEAQLAESAKVLARLTKVDAEEAQVLVDAAVGEFVIADLSEVAEAEPIARARLHERGQPDWPVLAASLIFDADIWSNDHDFFGVGVPVWSMRNIKHALAAGTSHG